MTLSTSRVVSSSSNRGFSAPGVPIRASTAVPPLAAFGTVAIGWQADTTSASAKTEIPTIRDTGLRTLMRRHPDDGYGADQEGGHDDPGGPVDLALEAAARAVTAAQAVATTTDRAAEPAGLGRLHEHPGHEQHGEHHFDDDERVLDPIHLGKAAILAADHEAGYLSRLFTSFQLMVLNQAWTESGRRFCNLRQLAFCQ